MHSLHSGTSELSVYENRAALYLMVHRNICIRRQRNHVTKTKIHHLSRLPLGCVLPFMRSGIARDGNRQLRRKTCARKADREAGN